MGKTIFSVPRISSVYLAILPVFFLGLIASQAFGVTCGSGYTDVSGVCIPDSSTVGNLSDKSVETIATNLMKWIIGLAGLVAILGFFASAFLYFTAAGDEDKAKLGKQAFWYTTIGVTIALGAFVVINVIDNFLKAGTI